MTTQLAALAAYLETIPYNDAERRYDIALDAGPKGNLLRVHNNKIFQTIYANKVDPANVKESIGDMMGHEAYWFEFIKIVDNFKN